MSNQHGRGIDEILAEETGFAYLAGIIDGEGSIGLQAHKAKGGEYRRSHFFVSRVIVANTNRDLLDAVARIAGTGRVREEHRGEGHKQVYVWFARVETLPVLLRKLLPYLVAKKKQAELLLRFLELRDQGLSDGCRGLSIEDYPEAQDIYWKLRELNRRGTTEFEEIDFQVREPQQRNRTCSEEGCEQRRYRSHLYCYQHWTQRRDPEYITCEQCGEQAVSIRGGKRFCSDRCQARHYWDTVLQPKGEAKRKRTASCPTCGKEFVTASKSKVYCSIYCGQKHRALKEFAAEKGLAVPLTAADAVQPKDWIETRQCERCGKEFGSNNRQRRYCSQVCISEAFRQRQRAEEIAAMGPCPVCGGPVDRSRYKGRVYCTTRCCQKARAARERSEE